MTIFIMYGLNLYFYCIFIFSKIAELYVDLRNFPKAEKNLQESMDIATKKGILYVQEKFFFYT